MTRSSRWGIRGTAAATIAARLRFENISHYYDQASIIRDVSLDIKPGEIIGLLGASGCGKTTLLRIAAGIERQTTGRILINECEVAGPRCFLPPERRGIGLIFQDYALFPHMTILDNVSFGLVNLQRAQAEREACAALRRVGLEHYAYVYPHMLSGGEQQRVALARAIVPRPSVLMMDEPFSSLDKRLRDDIRDETLAVLRETRVTCILVTHDPQEAMRFADRIVMMRSGSFIQIGSPHELYHHPVDLFTARFFSEFNKIPGTLIDNNGIITPLGQFSGCGYTKGQKVNVCIRPQGVLLSTVKGKGCIGRVLRRCFLGDVDLVEVIVENFDIPLISYIASSLQLSPGKEVTVDFDPDHILTFSASDESGM